MVHSKYVCLSTPDFLNTQQSFLLQHNVVCFVSDT